MVLESRERSIAYFSMEFALESGIPTYSGGLGVLSGDMLRAAADLCLPMLGVSLLYREGFFRQNLDSEGNQTESASEWQPERFLRRLPQRVGIEIEGRTVQVGAWQYTVGGLNGGSVPVYFLDSDLPENDERDRRLTGRLYIGDLAYRLCQEALLGLAGPAMLRELGYRDIRTFHMNEGHSALLTVALLIEESPGGRLEDAGEDEFARVRERCVFTTHTPVPAGHDKFPLELVRLILGEPLGYAISLLPPARHELNMTRLGMYFSRYANAVAGRHQAVAQAMFPEYRVNFITNGVHAGTWVAPALASLFDELLPGWRHDTRYLRQAQALPLDRLVSAHSQAKRLLLDEVARRSGQKLDESKMTIGFARRVATYKRANLLFADVPELRRINRDAGPIQVVYAGKAHPQDLAAKEIIREVYAARDALAGEVPVVYLENYDMGLGQLLCAGVDLWLNNPEKPMEASGTSGMKAALNGVPSLSTLDGWWPEGWVEGVTGWSVGDASALSEPEQERVSLYQKLGQVIVPLFYNSPAGYAQVMRSAIALNGSFFTAQRMAQQYARNAYRLS